ncbi:MAG: DEAD/DEAH box helicase [Chloroflexi bacterium]|nr:DEAD/DEAH box helicase [Chloroflexota bacterium]
MNAKAFIRKLENLPSYKKQIAHVQWIRPRQAKVADPLKPLPPLVQDRLEALGIKHLYSHQAHATDLARAGSNVMVATPAASGKTMCYNLPVAESLLADRRNRALYLFPTKALAQDQRRTFLELFGGSIIREDGCAVFDGDTPYQERAEIKNKGRVIITNPDMLHLGILPNHGAWSRLLGNLKYVVIDEAHVYRGVFGSHVANVIRRLRRLCALYGSRPQFIACSASIANPGEHAEDLVGLPFEVVDQDGSPHGSKYFLFWNAPVIGKSNDARASANGEATALLVHLIRNNIRTMVFTRTRRITELIYLYARRDLASSHLADRISPYRAGYTAEDRRSIERRLFNGSLLGVIATTALELGIDIGDLDATVLTGYPGSISSTWQQAGRSGRRKGDSLSVLIGLNNPLDQYFMRHPGYFFGKNYELALINSENPHVLKPHLLCAAWESPLTPADEEIFGEDFGAQSGELIEQGALVARESPPRTRPAGEHSSIRLHIAPTVDYPAQDISIRSSSQGRFSIVDDSRAGVQIETIEHATAFSQVHRGAIYLHQGESFKVMELDLEARTAHVVPSDAEYYTQAKELTDIRVVRTIRQRPLAHSSTFFGDVEVTTHVVGFKRKKQFSEEVMGDELLDLPPQRFRTQALWFLLPPGLEKRLAEKGLDLAGGLHAAEHASIAMLPLFALCDRNDIGGVSTPMHPDTGEASIFIYDAHPGGVGISEMGSNRIEELWMAALKAVSECPCQEGCPSCVQSPKCGNNNDPLDKKAAEELLDACLTG